MNHFFPHIKKERKKKNFIKLIKNTNFCLSKNDLNLITMNKNTFQTQIRVILLP